MVQGQRRTRFLFATMSPPIRRTAAMRGACDLRAKLCNIVTIGTTQLYRGGRGYDATPPAMAEAIHKAIAGNSLMSWPGSCKSQTPLSGPRYRCRAFKALFLLGRVSVRSLMKATGEIWDRSWTLSAERVACC